MFSRSGSRSNFNPRSPHGERPVIEMNPASASRISIHAPRRGSDLQSDVGSALLGAISIHAPRRGSDGSPRQDRRRLSISIHAPRRGSDSMRVAHWLTSPNFNPRSPQGERLNAGMALAYLSQFQSTLPAGGATRSVCLNCGSYFISIHAPRRGSDSRIIRCTRLHSDFNPRSPQGERLRQFRIHRTGSMISIHAPRRGSDTTFRLKPIIHGISIHAPRRGSDANSNWLGMAKKISIHAPRRGSDSTVKAYSNDRIKRSTLREPHFLFSKNACFSPIFSMCATTSRTKNQRIRVSFGSYPGLAPMCFTLDWYRFPRL